MSGPLTDVQPTVRSRRILLVEDNAVNQRVAVGLLTKRGHHVTVANNGREALTALDQSDPFDLVLMDIQMPDMDGLEATTRIRQREQQTGEHLRIIAMTAHAMKGDRERFLASGMDAYLAKPVDPQAIFEMVESASHVPQPRGVDPTLPQAFDVEEMSQRLGDDEELIADVIRLFLEDCPVRLGSIRSAVEARDVERLRAAAHALKGSASNLSARGVVAAARALEAVDGTTDAQSMDACFAALVSEAERLAAVLRDFNPGGN
jgi:CheY-like chemotaxis protein/HPt (histidine-containing phosphotransfer) domain-containing protein